MAYLVSSSELQKIFPNSTPAELNRINQEISGTVQEYCNTTFYPMDYTDELYDSISEVIPIHRPIIEVYKIEDNKADLYEDLDFYVYTDKIIIDRPSGVRKGIKLDYLAGYEIVPQLVRDAALELARFRAFKEIEGSLLFYKKQSIEERSYEFDLDMSEGHILSVLSNYVQPRLVSGRQAGLKVGYML